MHPGARSAATQPTPRPHAHAPHGTRSDEGESGSDASGRRDVRQILFVDVDAASDAGGRGVEQGNLLACTFHPEISGDVRVHQYFVDLVSSDPRTYAC
jgi:hypothetical protein